VEPSLKMVNEAFENPELEPKRDVIGTVKGLLETAANMDQRIIEGFKAERGQEISVQLANGVKKLTIVSVKDGKVFGRQTVGTGGALITVPMTFEARDLTLREKIARMGSEESKPDVALIKGLMAWNAKAYPQARKFFAFTHPLLADRLVACVAIAEKIEEEKRVVAAQAVEKPGDEPNAVKISAVAIKPPALSAELAAIEGNVKAIRSYLLDRNPDMLTRECIFKTDKAGKVYRVEIWSENLSDIGALAAFRDLKELVCGARGRMCKLSDLSAVRGLPLESLHVEFAGVRDLSCLKGMALKRIIIRNCPLADLSPLKDMTALEELQLGGTEVKDLSPLKGLKIKRLELCSTRVADIRLLSGMPLESLDISNTKIADLSLLKGKPLTVLQINGSQVKDLRPLEGLALRYLNCRNTAVRSFDPLKKMPLTSIDMDEPNSAAKKILRTLPNLQYVNGQAYER
jgi:hypothetical protein